LTLVIEEGAYLNDFKMPDRFRNKGIDVLCQTGSYIKVDSSLSATQISEPKRWEKVVSELDYLIGVSLLFHEPQFVSKMAVPALGGKVNKSPGQPRITKRVLKGFGGCRFRQHDK